MSLAFHIVFAAFGIGMPLMMAIAEGMYLRTGKEIYLELCKRWARATAILFAVGAVSGTVLSFELGLLWPAFTGGFTIYLTWPTGGFNPAWMVLPFGAAVAWTMSVMASTFKKYL